MVTALMHLLLALPATAGEVQGEVLDEGLAAAVRPLLAKRCGACHGPDEATREGDLRLDLDGDLFGDRGGYRVVVPGDLEASELWYRLTAEDPEDQMPPPGQVALEASEVELLRRWIEAGAPWEEHWSYVPPVRPEVPTPGDGTWARNPIDVFVLARLEAEGLVPSAPANPTALARRARLDLTGLPPGLEELDAFLAAWDQDPGAAWSAWIDGLFDSVDHAEHRAAQWLDLARYADSNGYEKDGGRSIWRYRDWVVDAYAADMPFDAFTRLQLAGDLMADGTLEELVATGFHRNTMVNEEGGTDPEEFRVAAVMDRVETTATVWLGTTMGCARCHTHKYDPVTHEEYFRTFALFDDTVDTGNSLEPVVAVPTREQAVHLEQLEQRVEHLRASLEGPDEALDALQAAWEAALLAEPRSPLPELGAWLRTEVLAAESFQAAFDEVGTAEGLVLAGDDPFTGVAFGWRRAPEVVDGEVLALEGQNTTFLFCRSIWSDEPQDVTLALGSDDGIKVWLNGMQVHANAAQRAAVPGQDRVVVRLPRGRSLLLAKVVNGGGPGGFCFELEPTLPGGLDAEAFALLEVPAGERDAAGSRALRRFFRSTELEPGRGLAFAEGEARAELDALRAEIPTTPVLRAVDQPRITRVLAGGNFLAPLQTVEAGAPAALGPAKLPTDRLELADWLCSPDNPLTARVTVNRLWQSVFGAGLVTTGDDFGTQGEPPSHPELLDWLAVELVESGWDTEHLLRLMVDSAVWRQGSAVTAELLERDPANRLLARAPIYRLSAEVLRDTALRTAGLLDRTVGGPSVYPPQPEGTWAMTYSGERWMTDEGGDRFRRGMYVYRRRTAPYPTFALFDAPSRELACARRDRTSTPLQALALFNDPAFFEAAGGLARRVLGETAHEGDRVRLVHAFRLCTSRPPTDAELAALVAYLEGERARLAADPERAATLAASVVLPDAAELGLAEPELAAWTLMASVLLNLDEALNRR